MLYLRAGIWSDLAERVDRRYLKTMPTTTYLISAAALVLFAFLTFRVFVRRDYLTKGRLGTRSVVLEYLVFFLWAYFTYLNWPSAVVSSELSPALRLTAWVLIVFGLGVMFTAMAQLGIRRMHGLDSKSLEESGLYGATRNPQTIGSVLAVLGYAMYWPSWNSVGWVILYVIITHMMVLTEEEHLRRVFGEEYASYSTRVPRYLRLARP